MEHEEQHTANKTPRTGKTREYWTEEVRRWRTSGLTQKHYCIREGISLERLGTWKRRLDREGQKQTGALVAVPSRIVSSALHVSATIKVVIDERYRVEIPDAFSPATLETVLHVLNRL
jgi:hypothetical protein